MELERLKRGRTAARGWATRANKSLAEVLSAEDLDLFELKEALKECEKRLSALDDVQTSIELETEESELGQVIEEAAIFRELIVKNIRAASRKLLNANEGDNDGASGSASSPGLRLPRLDLPTFSGDILHWTHFWESYENSVHNRTDIVDITKLTYLRSLLKGEAAQCIAGLALTGLNYANACELLKDRYGRPELIIFRHVEGLLALHEACNVTELQHLQDQLLAHVRSLNALGVTGDKYGVILAPLVLSKLPKDICLQWARNSAGKESDLEWLLTFLKEDIESRVRSGVFGSLNPVARDTTPPVKPAASRRGTPAGGQREWKRPPPARAPSGAALQSGPPARSGQEVQQSTSAPIPSGCGFCSATEHEAAECRGFRSLEISDRQNKVRQTGLCFECLKSGHRARFCLERCAHCKGRHHILCCYKRALDSKRDKQAKHSDTNPSGDSRHDVTPTVSLSCVPPQQCSVLPTARVLVTGSKGAVEANVMFDTGSDRSYISQSLVRKIGATWLGSERNTYCAFGGGKSAVSDRNVYEIEVAGVNIPEPSSICLKAMEVPLICSPLQRPQVPKEVVQFFRGLDLADGRLSSDRQLTVDLLVGLDQYWQVMKDGLIRTSTGLVAQETVFGWTISGIVEGKTPSTSCQLLLLSDMPDHVFRNMWDLEAVGVTEDDSGLGSNSVLEDFDASICKKGDRYEVSLPWKKDRPDLKDNRASAEARLVSLRRKFDRDPQLGKRYDNVLQELERSEIIEEVPDHEMNSSYPVYYLPHRPVVKEDSMTTKVRPVFDASAVDPEGVSLNDCLEVGPCLIPKLIEILLRFRRWRFAVVADITKAFLQIQIRKEDRDVQRFLWWHGGRTRVMRFRRVTFGVCSSSFLLSATIRHHLSQYPASPLIVDLGENFYVDDYLSGADTEDGACAKLKGAQAVMSEAGMNLTKCTSNSPAVFDASHGVTSAEGGQVKVLGVRWAPSRDLFSFDGVNLPTDVIPTKRVVLSFIARLYDPLGFITPFVMTAKMTFQEVWQLGLDWDDPLPGELSNSFSQWLRDLELLKSFEIPRCLADRPWNDGEGVELHAFGDASPKGYGAVVYLRAVLDDGSFAVSLVMAKGRVAPLKRLTLPRLELMGSLMAARLLTFVHQALRLPESTTLRCWTDSMVALGWIRGDPQRWKQFVSNRVTEIHRLTNPSCWSFTPGEDNPADLVTRGVSAGRLMDSELWLNGPAWLSSPTGAPPLSEFSVGAGPDASVPEEMALLSTAEAPPTELFGAERWGSLRKAVRIVAWVRRFVFNCRNPGERRQCELTSGELAEARSALLKDVQRTAFVEEIRALQAGVSIHKSSPLRHLTPFLDEEGLLRVRGRLQMCDLAYEAKHPVLLPKGRVSELLVRDQHVLMCHAGVSTLITAVRGAYWIIGLRCIAKRVKRSCVGCRRQDAPTCNEPAAPLPESRVSEAPPFAVTGVDHAGPVYCVDFPGQKFYITLFTCAVTRAVHVELVNSLSQEQFILALRRFAARRGMPSIIYSDNAKTFLGASVQLQKHLGHLAPEWRLITPRSPWHGGWWERLIRSLKSSLRKSLGQRCLTRTELETVLFDIEGCINSRPLTFVGDGVDCANALTPNHFLLGRGAGFQSKVLEDPSSVSSISLTERAKACERRVNKFWAVWRNEYLRNLPPSVRHFSSRGKLREGSVVLIREDNVPRMKWVTGVVTKLYPGRDGTVRSAELRTSHGLRTRAIQRLHDLELDRDPPATV